VRRNQQLQLPARWSAETTPSSSSPGYLVGPAVYALSAPYPAISARRTDVLATLAHASTIGVSEEHTTK
jgi:hypothetical protein